MKVLGIIAEYNPFHNGHLHHLRTCRAAAKADCTVIIMSGNYTQRGEPALVNKWARAEMALLNGADLAIDLPTPFAMASAEFFARGAVSLLNSLGVVNLLCFGSECGDLESLQKIASILAAEPRHYKESLKSSLAVGKSFPAARQKALSDYLIAQSGKDNLSMILEKSNNILAVEYLKALKFLKSSIVPITIPRVDNEYTSTLLSGNISSATSIRKIINDNSWPTAKKLLEKTLPDQSIAILEREFDAGRGPVFPSDFSQILISSLRKMTLEEIAALPYIENGLENRLKKAAEISGSYLELINNTKTKRYTITRIQRCLFSLMIGLTKNFHDDFTENSPSYIRVLGFNNTGRRLLSMIRDSTSLPLITKTADFKNSNLTGVADMLKLEAMATDQYVLGFKNPEVRTSGNEYLLNVIYLNTD